MKNKKIKKLTAFLAAMVLTFSAASQTFSVSAVVDTTKTDIDLTYKRFDPQLIADAGEKLKNACAKKDNNDEVISCCKAVCDATYKYNTATQLSNIMQLNGENPEEYLYEMSINTAVSLAVSDALYAPMKESEYSALISENVPAPIKLLVETYHNQADADNENDVRIAEALNDYNTLLSEMMAGKYTAEEFELKTADLYLTMIKTYKEILAKEDPDLTLEDYFNSLYNRDYSYEDIKNCKDSISKLVSFLSGYVVTSLNNVLANTDQVKLVQYITTPNEDFDLINDVLLKYTPDISEEYAKNAAYLRDANLLLQGNPAGTPSGYTIPFLEFKTPLIYITAPDDADKAIFLTHEFGHFNAFINTDFDNDDMNSVNLDIAEVQSQGMEVLYLNYYDDMFGEFSGYLKMGELNRLITILQLGCFVNDFEHDVFQAPESFSAEQIVKLFHEKQSLYGIPEQNQSFFGASPNYINSPYYCISYAMSLIPALKLLEIESEDPKKAKQIYYDYTKIDAYNSENSFLDSLEKTGFGNVLDNDYIDDLRYFISDYADSVEGIINGDISGDGTVSADDLLLLKKIMLGDIEEYDIRTADLTRDGKLSASDLTSLVLKLLN